jgi:20S proteasome alpha/beta subunit
MGLKAIARMIQTMLYAKRFFPYYVYNILGGIEEDGKLLTVGWTRELTCRNWSRVLI